MILTLCHLINWQEKLMTHENIKIYEVNCISLSISFPKETEYNWLSSVKKEANLLGECQVYKREKDFIDISIEIKDMETKKSKAE